MRIFVINLKRSAARRHNIETQLRALDLPFEISEGVDALNFSPEESEAFKSGLENRTHNLSPGLFGSSWAHIKVYEKMIRENIPVALVLEDDIVVDSALKRVIKESWVQASFWDFVHIGYGPASWSSLTHWFKVAWRQVKVRPTLIWTILLKAPLIVGMSLFEMVREKIWKLFGPRPVRFARSLYWGDGYLITNAGAKKLLSIAYPIRYGGDELFNRARKEAGLRFYGYCPPVVRPNDVFPSDAAYSNQVYEVLKQVTKAKNDVV